MTCDVILGCRGQQHAFALHAAHHARGEIGDDDDLLADQGRRLVMAANAGDELPLLRAQIDLENEQLVGGRVGSAWVTVPTRRSSLRKSSN